MVVDVGAGTTEIGVLALGGLVTQASVPVGGGDFDQAISGSVPRFRARDRFGDREAIQVRRRERVGEEDDKRRGSGP